MKKLFITITLICLSLLAFSQKMKVVSGSLDFLKDEKSFKTEFTYNNMQVGGMQENEYLTDKVKKYNEKEAGKGDKWLESWTSDRKARFEPNFIELYNKHMSEKNGAIIGDGGNYKMIVNTHFTEPGFNVGVARRNAAVSLTCTFINNETGEEAARVSVTNSSANNFWGADFDSGYRLQESYSKAGRELAKFFIKQLKLK